MRKRIDPTVLADKAYINLEELQTFLSLGRCTADALGREAGAIRKIGRRKIYSVEKIKEYIEGNYGSGSNATGGNE